MQEMEQEQRQALEAGRKRLRPPLATSLSHHEYFASSLVSCRGYSSVYLVLHRPLNLMGVELLEEV